MTHEQLVEAKRRTGYTTAQISEKTDIPVGTLNKLFSGVTKNPRRDTILALERFFIEDDGWLGKKGDVYYENKGDGAYYVHQGSASYDMNFKPQGSYTIEDYKSLPEGVRMELIDGCMYTMESPTFTHQIMTHEFYRQVSEYIEKKKGNCFVTNMSIDVYLNEGDNSAVVPDLFILCDRSKMKEDGVHGAPDFILEVISKSGKGRDLYAKMMKYFNSGVREYWVIDPIDKVIYEFDFENQIPMDIRPLTGKKKMRIYNGELEIDLDKVVQAASKFYET